MPPIPREVGGRATFARACESAGPSLGLALARQRIIAAARKFVYLQALGRYVRPTRGRRFRLCGKGRLK